MRLIDADVLKEKFLDMGCLDDKPCYGAEILDRMPTVCDIEQIRDEIQKVLDAERDYTSENAKAQAIALSWCLEIIDNYVEERQTAEWEKFGKNTYACTNCRRGVYSREKYCPECGSLMKIPLKGG